MAARLPSSILGSLRPSLRLPLAAAGVLPIASHSRGPSLTRAAHSHSLAPEPPRDVYVDGAKHNPLSPTAHLPEAPFTPLFPLYVPLAALSPVAPPSDALVPIPRDLFDVPLRRDVLHACVVHQLSLTKVTSMHMLIRSEVRGSGKKIHRQKGTGKARVGDSGSSIRVRTGKVHGGKAFGPRSDRDWSTDLPRKVRQLGLKVALSQKLREGRLRIVDEQGLVMDDWSEMYPRNEPLGQPVWAAAKTGFVRERIDALGLKKLLILHCPFHPPPADLLPRGVRALKDVQLMSVSSATTLDLLRAGDVVLDLHAIQWLVGQARLMDNRIADSAFDGNAMVMRRRKLGLSDFPKEGEVDESKEILRLLEEEASGDFAYGFDEVEEGESPDHLEQVEDGEEYVFTEAEAKEIEEDAARLVNGLEGKPKGSSTSTP